MELRTATKPLRVAIALIAPCSMSGAGPILDALRLANEIDGRTLVEWQVLSVDGRPVALGGGAQVAVDTAFGDAIDDLDAPALLVHHALIDGRGAAAALVLSEPERLPRLPHARRRVRPRGTRDVSCGLDLRISPGRLNSGKGL